MPADGSHIFVMVSSQKGDSSFVSKVSKICLQIHIFLDLVVMCLSWMLWGGKEVFLCLVFYAGRCPSENRTRTSARGRGLLAESKCRCCSFISHWFQTSHLTQAPFWYFQTMPQTPLQFPFLSNQTISLFPHLLLHLSRAGKP